MTSGLEQWYYRRMATAATELELPSETEWGSDLNNRQFTFVLEYTSGKSGAQAYLAAYGGENYEAAKVSASNLLTNPNVAKALRQRWAQTAQRLSITAQMVIAAAWSIFEDTSNPAGARVQALSLISQTFPDFSAKLLVQRETLAAEAIRLAAELGMTREEALAEVRLLSSGGEKE